MSNGAVSVVLDASATGPPDPAHIEQLRQEAMALLEAGEADKAANVMQQARDAVNRSQLATETIVALTDEQLAQRDVDQAAGLDARKAQRRLEIESVLAWTDRWAARAVEEAVPMPPARIRYRQALRALFTDIAAAADIPAVEAVKIPAPPPNP